LACLEQAVREHGDELLRRTLQRVVNAQEQGSKKGSSPISGEC